MAEIIFAHDLHLYHNPHLLFFFFIGVNQNSVKTTVYCAPKNRWVFLNELLKQCLTHFTAYKSIWTDVTFIYLAKALWESDNQALHRCPIYSMDEITECHNNEKYGKWNFIYGSRKLIACSHKKNPIPRNPWSHADKTFPTGIKFNSAEHFCCECEISVSERNAFIAA